MAFEQLEPFGALHQEQMAGAVCAVMANMHLKPGAKALAPADFMPALRRALDGYATPGELPNLTPAERAAELRRLVGGKGSAKKRGT